jgi:hypothetical protein
MRPWKKSASGSHGNLAFNPRPGQKHLSRGHDIPTQQLLALSITQAQPYAECTESARQPFHTPMTFKYGYGGIRIN